MRERDRSGALVAPGVVVAATKGPAPKGTSIKRLPHFLTARTQLTALLVLFSLLFSFQNCAVELASTTPGAMSVVCAPSAAMLTAFLPIMTGTLQATGKVGSQQGCANCHVTGPGTGSFKILAGTTNDVQVANFCSAQSRKTRLAIHPTENSHMQVYSAADISVLTNWVSSL